MFPVNQTCNINAIPYQLSMNITKHHACKTVWTMSLNMEPCGVKYGHLICRPSLPPLCTWTWVIDYMCPHTHTRKIQQHFSATTLLKSIILKSTDTTVITDALDRSQLALPNQLCLSANIDKVANLTAYVLKITPCVCAAVSESTGAYLTHHDVSKWIPRPSLSLCNPSLRSVAPSSSWRLSRCHGRSNAFESRFMGLQCSPGMWLNSRTLLTATAGAGDPNVALLRTRGQLGDIIIMQSNQKFLPFSQQFGSINQRQQIPGKTEEMMESLTWLWFIWDK